MPLGVEKEAIQNVAAAVGEYFSVALHRPVEARLFNYDLQDALTHDKVDVAFMPALGYLEAAQRAHVQLVRKVVRQGEPSYVSVLFVRQDSGIQRFEDLEHKKIAWVQKGSASGHLVPRSMLRQRQLDPATFFAEELFLQDHGKVCEAVADGTVDVGASFADVTHPGAKADGSQPLVEGCSVALSEAQLKNLRIVSWGDSIPNDVVVARNGLPEELVRTLGAALDKLATTPEGTNVLHNGFHADAFVVGADSDFVALRKLSLLYPQDG